MSIKLLRHEFFGVALCLVGVDYINPDKQISKQL